MDTRLIILQFICLLQYTHSTSLKEAVLREYYRNATIQFANANESLHIINSTQQSDLHLTTQIKWLEIANSSQIFNKNQLNLTEFTNLIVLNLTHNRLTHIHSSPNSTFNLKFLQVSSNNLTNVDFLGVGVFRQIEYLLVDSNSLEYVTVKLLGYTPNLIFIDLSGNKLKFLHPVFYFSLQYLDLHSNRLEQTYVNGLPTGRLRYLNLNGNRIRCDCTLTGLLDKRFELEDGFECGDGVALSSLNRTYLQATCTKPKIDFDISQIMFTSQYTQLELMAKKWFNWFIFADDTYREPYIETHLNNDEMFSRNLTVTDLSVYRLSDVRLKCGAQGSPQPAIVWHTSSGYFTNIKNTSSYSQIFYKLSNITKLTSNLTVRVSEYGGAQTVNTLSVNDRNELEITNIRQKFVGKLSCLALNGAGAEIVDFYIDIRVGASDQFIYCLLVGVIVSCICSIFGAIICAINERHSLDSFPMTPPYFPTPLDTHASTTPPNFDINQWMTNAASNITETLDQVRKKLHRGVEKASTTVKSIGVHSSAYLYSMYEHSQQRLSNIKSYVPTLTVPTITLPTMRYSNQLATRMGRLRMGVADYFLQIREFCGTSDLMHTTSMATLKSDTNASQAVGQIMDINMECTVVTMQKLLNNISEEDDDESKEEQLTYQPQVSVASSIESQQQQRKEEPKEVAERQQDTNV